MSDDRSSLSPRPQVRRVQTVEREGGRRNGGFVAAPLGGMRAVVSGAKALRQRELAGPDTSRADRVLRRFSWESDQ